jgi:hypothetical protein
MSSANKQDDFSGYFAQLVMSFYAAAWQQMGKTLNPMTGKTERNLELAKNSIDILGMLEDKTKGNLTDEEAKYLQHVLTELRMNYVEESKKPDPPVEEKTESDSASDDRSGDDAKQE